jgi:hypothetical protein
MAGDTQIDSALQKALQDRFVLLKPGETLYFCAENGQVKAKKATESLVVN